MLLLLLLLLLLSFLALCVCGWVGGWGDRGERVKA